MNKYLLEMFVAVVETRRITAAARLLNLTQPAVSQQIRHLEAYFGTPLLTRDQSGVTPTKAGEILYNRARQILSAFDCLEREIDELTNADEKEICIGATPTVGSFALPCSLWTFRDRFPKANLRLEVAEAPEIAARLQERSLHIAIVEGVLPDRVSGCPGAKCRALSGDQVLLVTPVRGPWDNGRLTEEALRTASLVAPARGAGIRSVFEQAMAQRGLELKDLNLLDQFGGLEGMKSVVESRGGVLVAARMSVQKELKRRIYRDVTPEWLQMEMPFHLICVEDSLPPAARRFVRFIGAPEEMAPCWA